MEARKWLALLIQLRFYFGFFRGFKPVGRAGGRSVGQSIRPDRQTTQFNLSTKHI